TAAGFHWPAMRRATASACARPVGVSGNSARPRKRAGLMPSTWPWRVRRILVTPPSYPILTFVRLVEEAASLKLGVIPSAARDLNLRRERSLAALGMTLDCGHAARLRDDFLPFFFSCAARKRSAFSREPPS